MDLFRVLQLVYFMLPAYAANMAPPFLKFWTGWNPPLSVRALGAHKTVLGVAAGLAAAILIAGIQARVAWNASLIVYDAFTGARFGLGAMGGDSAKSFVKRRLGIAPGARWIPFDQLDFAVGALLLTWSSASLTWLDAGAILVLTAIGHVVVDHLAYWLGLRDTRW
jgi:CDP-2,3-bis-(O-geranylgeranyl)-sn-glycerol synthase